MARGRSIRVKAFAKINLSLHVLGVRSDGYHQLSTVFQSVGLFDTLTFTRRSGPFALTCDDERCPADATNLIWRAAAGVWRASGRSGAPRDVAVRLVKRIPMQAGLGGGSSDAAAAMRVLARLWRVPAGRLERMARRLGADVPYFLMGGTALGQGRGDRLVPLRDHTRRSLVIVVPPFGVSTQEAYGWFDRDSAGAATTARPLTNDLQAPVARRRPEIARLLSELREAGASQAAMSGSGSAVFGVFKTAAAAARCARQVRGRGRTVETVRTLTRRECRALAPK
jgi:4-diphosphocytidyl-2-C-methyl-D-erythritol kinase